MIKIMIKCVSLQLKQTGTLYSKRDWYTWSTPTTLYDNLWDAFLWNQEEWGLNTQTGCVSSSVQDRKVRTRGKTRNFSSARFTETT